MLLPWFALHYDTTLDTAVLPKSCFWEGQSQHSGRRNGALRNAGWPLCEGEGSAVVGTDVLTVKLNTHQAPSGTQAQERTRWLCLEVDALLRHFCRTKNKSVKGLVQVAVGAEGCHTGLVLLWLGFTKLWGHFPAPCAATMRATLWVSSWRPAQAAAPEWHLSVNTATISPGCCPGLRRAWVGPAL